MTKKFTAFLTALLCMTGTVLSLPVSAEFRIENGKVVGDIGDDINEGLTMPDEDDYRVKDDEYVRPEPKYTYTTDTFTYKSNNFTTRSGGFFLETELADPDLMVVGFEYSADDPDKIGGYIVTTVNNDTGTGKLFQSTVKKELGDVELRVGDLIKFDGSYDMLAIIPPVFVPSSDNTTIVHLGNGVDIFGEEFERVIRMQMVLEQDFIDRFKEMGFVRCDIDLVKGDVNIDDELSVLDCLAINRNLLIGEPLCDYAKLAGDINENGTIDAVDSLSILKECINITENFE